MYICLGPITEQYLEDVAANLGIDWSDLAQCLRIPRGIIESIKVNHDDDAPDAQHKSPGMNMFMYWHKRTATSTDKVSSHKMYTLIGTASCNIC